MIVHVIILVGQYILFTCYMEGLYNISIFVRFYLFLSFCSATVSPTIHNFPYRNVACVLHIYLLPYCTYCAYTLHAQYIHIACVLHTQKLAQRHTHATYMHMRSHTSEYMQLFMYSIHAACKQMHTNCIHFLICLYGMRVALSQFLCMLYCVCSTRAAYMCARCGGWKIANSTLLLMVAGNVLPPELFCY